MARKQQAPPKPLPKFDYKSTIDQLLRVNKFEEAISLARLNVSHESSTETLALLHQTILDCINRLDGSTRHDEIRKILLGAEGCECNDPNYWHTLAYAYARLDDGPSARRMLAHAPDPAADARITGILFDHMMVDRQHGRDRVPPEHRTAFNLIRQAFGEYDGGKDEEARQTLQGIGLQSPFLEWKLLLRGLISYSTNDDARANENWQRLDPMRLPSRLAAPLRYAIDPSWRATLKPEQVAPIVARANHIGNPLLVTLKKVQREFGEGKRLNQTLKTISSATGMLKLSFPEQAKKLANVFYWQFPQGGSDPQDLEVFKRTFGPPADDPNLDRLKAIVFETMNLTQDANPYWKNYLDWIEKTPERWPGGQNMLARAMLLCRIGENALDDMFSPFSDSMERDAFEKFLELGGFKSPEACFREATSLAPQWSEPVSKLLDLLVEQERWPEAEEVGLVAISHHPDDIPLLILVSQVQQAQGKVDEALGSLQRALQTNPLDKDLRLGVANLSVQAARSFVVEKRFEEAKNLVAQSMNEPGHLLPLISRGILVACEYKAGNPDQAQRLIAEATPADPYKPSQAYILAVEAGRAKVKKEHLVPLESAFTQVLANGMIPREWLGLVQTLGCYKNEKPKYRGIGKHEKTIHAGTSAAIRSLTKEEDLYRMGSDLLRMRVPKLLKECADLGEKLFPRSPAFPYYLGEQMILQKPKSFSARLVCSLFGKAKMYCNSDDERGRQIEDAIDKRFKELPELEEWMYPNYDDDYDEDIW